MIAKACLRQGSFAPGNPGIATTGGRSASAAPLCAKSGIDKAALVCSRSRLSKPNKGRIKVQLGTSAAWLNARALSGVGATRYEEVL